MAKECGYCGTRSKHYIYKKLPNGLKVCSECYRERNMNPLMWLGYAWWAWKNRETLPPEVRDAVEKRGKPKMYMHQFLAILKEKEKEERMASS